MSIRFSKKHLYKSFVNPEAFIKSMSSAKPLPSENLIYCYHSFIIDLVQEALKLEKLGSGFYLYKDKGSDKKVVLQKVSSIGAPATVALLEESIHLGARNIVTLGSAGALVSKYEVGDIVVAAEAFRDEGTSRHYLSTDNDFIAASPQLLARCSRWSQVKTWTTDAPYRETQEEIAHYRSHGIDCVEMEASAVYSLAKYHNIEALSFLVISDFLHGSQWKPHFNHENLKISFKNAIETIIRDVL